MAAISTCDPEPKKLLGNTARLSWVTRRNGVPRAYHVAEGNSPMSLDSASRAPRLFALLS
jgi:hypothetical protein